ncbi:unnamed protein product [Nippostrongylus brasiliensis]|uniref:DUF1758 domain-containing protein n=1 Tax=Nippostrongylus brasiliensis TaxID=27835 RepID=A0A158QXQ1_NIPBR|nr:unnamed protein product [Nippostrongylus brasiliensis]
MIMGSIIRSCVVETTVGRGHAVEEWLGAIALAGLEEEPEDEVILLHHKLLYSLCTIVGTIREGKHSPPPEGEKKSRASEVRLALKVCEEHTALLESSLNNLAEAFEKMEEHSKEDEVQFDQSLSASTARGPSTEDQRQLFEKLSAIAAQLQDLGEHMDTYLAVHTFVQKFHSRIQKSVMKKLLQQDVTADWSFNLWLHTIDSIISQEEKMKELLSENSDRSKPPRPQSSVPLSSGCEFCNQRGHRWNSCPRIPTAAAKREFLLETNRCLNCGSNKHRVASCPSGNCRICHEKHNTAICTRKLGRNQRNDTNRSAPPTATERQPRSSPAEAFKQKPTKSVRQHVITKEAESSAAQAKQETIVLQTHRQAGKPSKVILLVGTVKVLDSKDQVHEAVVLLDTGSEVSFISEDLARKLDLPVVDRTPLCISTFGATSPSTKMYDVAKLRFYDIEGCKHELCLHQTEHITGTIEQTELDEEDAIFISKHGIVLSMEYKSEAVQPQLLLGCDYLWDFMMPVEMPEYNQMFTMASQESTDDEDRAPATAISLLTTRHTNVDELTLFPLNRFNSLQKAQRVAAYVLRFIKKALCHFPPWRKDAIIEAIPALRVSASTHEFSGPELSEARKCIIRDHQQNIVSKLGAKPQMELNVKHDGEGVLRCYGQVHRNELNTVREVVVELPNKHKIRRPINRVVPLEVGAVDDDVNSELRPTTTTDDLQKPHEPDSVVPRYNLRKRKQTNYKEDDSEDSQRPSTSSNVNVLRTLPLTFALLLLIIPSTVRGHNTTGAHHLQCVENGVRLLQTDSNPYDVCTTDYCVSVHSPRQSEVIKFPPQSTLHDYPVKWKITKGETVEIVETICKATPFCANINCILCTANIANPECWPKAAIAGMGLALYLIFLMCYALFAVPLIVGRPLISLLRLLALCGQSLLRAAVNLSTIIIPRGVIRLLAQFRHRPRRRIWSELAVLLTVTMTLSRGCQELLVILGDAEVAKSRKQFSVRLLPNQPKKLSWLTLTLSSLAVPPTPILSSTFLTNGKQTALAPRHYSPPLVCKTWSDARNLFCEVDEDCTCTPAEEKMHCDCKNINLTSYVREPDRSIPQIRPNVELNVARQQLIAKIPQLPTAEFVLRIHGRFGTTALISDAICTVENVHCVGCYKCTKGAQAVVNCKSSTPQETAEVRCGDNSFAIPCTYEGTHSKLRFYPDTARFYVNCTVRCGHTAHQFEITGILHYTGSLHGAVRRLVNGESEVYSEINFPDFGHMADVFLHWTGSLVLVIVLAAIAILTTYLCLSSTLLLSLTRFLLRLILTMLCNIVRLAKLIACKLLWKHVHHEYQHRHKPDHKLL